MKREKKNHISGNISYSQEMNLIAGLRSICAHIYENDDLKRVLQLKNKKSEEI